MQYLAVSRPGDTEPNDLAGAAQEVVINTSISGNLGHRKTGMYDDIDWYKFTVNNDGRLTISDTTTSTLDYTLSMFEEDGTTLLRQMIRYKDNSGTTIAISLLPGTYYVKFDRYGGDYTTYGEYSYTLKFIQTSRPGDAEPNDVFNDAQEILLNTSVSGNLGYRKTGMYDNSDWYAFTVPADGRLTLRDTTASTLEYMAGLYEEDGTTLIYEFRRFHDNSGTPIAISLLPGKYYLQFDKYGADYSIYGEYTFTLQYKEVLKPGDAEPNDSVQHALAIK
jgi:hypothetical protein